MNVRTGTVIKLPVQNPAFFGFVSNNQVYVVSGSQLSVQWFALQSNPGQTGQVKTASTWHAPQQINGVFDDGSALVVGIGGPSAGDAIGSGKVLSLVGTHATTIVSKSADYWWYDEMNHHIYFYVQDGSAA